ncbi:hypothetical protein V8E54_011414 [Elaphomyces granulatus]
MEGQLDEQPQLTRTDSWYSLDILPEDHELRRIPRSVVRQQPWKAMHRHQITSLVIPVPDSSGIHGCGVRILHPDTSSVSYPSIKPIRNRYQDVKYGCQARLFLRNLALDVIGDNTYPHPYKNYDLGKTGPLVEYPTGFSDLATSPSMESPNYRPIKCIQFCQLVAARAKDIADNLIKKSSWRRVFDNEASSAIRHELSNEQKKHLKDLLEAAQRLLEPLEPSKCGCILIQVKNRDDATTPEAIFQEEFIEIENRKTPDLASTKKRKGFGLLIGHRRKKVSNVLTDSSTSCKKANVPIRNGAELRFQ